MLRRSMRFWMFSFLLCVPSCGPDPEPFECHGANDFEVTIFAESGPLPSDTVLRLHYGGRAYDDPEELVLADPGTPQALFCYVASRNGDVPPNAPALGSKANAGAGGEGGAADGGAPVDALVCKLWTGGSADLEVVTQMYGTVSVKLQTKKRVCTVKSEV